MAYQNDPCPTGEKRAAPTVEQLNADRQKKLTQAAAKAPPSRPSAPRTGSQTTAGGTSPSRAQSANERPQFAAEPIPLPSESFKCDGRIHCSQMASCAAAKYFLSRCPGVKMDGNRDGIPCGDQWCTHWSDSFVAKADPTGLHWATAAALAIKAVIEDPQSPLQFRPATAPLIDDRRKMSKPRRWSG